MVDYLVLTFIREEYEAVRRHFQDTGEGTVSGTPGSTRVVQVTTRGRRSATVAVARTVSQGNLSALDAVRELIFEVEPRIVLAVGIAGAVPKSDVFLGDVVLANDVHNLTLGAETAAGREEAASSTYLMPAVKEFIANLTIDDLAEWRNRMASIPRPEVSGIGTSWTTNAQWNNKINKVLEDNEKRSLPTIVDGVIASSDHLVKSEEFMERRLLVDRHILANDMESAGVATACDRRGVPLLILRGISDIVGHTRSEDWKLYACEAVAACAREIVNLESFSTIERKIAKGESVLRRSTRDAINSLDAALARIRRGDASEFATACREAFGYFQELEDDLMKRRWAPELFETLDRPMKYLGDKGLVLKVARAVIDCCSVTELDIQTAECQARARICGTSWAYQRTGHLGLAEEEALRSAETSEGIGSAKNLAFCRKCLGRLKRLRAEAETNAEVKQAFFEESERSLHEAIDQFSNLAGHGPDDPEVGDCYSLLGRTYLSMRDTPRAIKCAIEAMRRINPESKDYLDLRILEGDICLAKRDETKALEAFDEVIGRSSEQDYQISEIVARAHRQRARALMRVGRNPDAELAFAKAQRIWEHYEENSLAAEAQWGRIRASDALERRTILLLEKEAAPIRCEAVRLYQERQSSRSRKVIAQRIGSDDAVWGGLVTEAKRNLALHS